MGLLVGEQAPQAFVSGQRVRKKPGFATFIIYVSPVSSLILLGSSKLLLAQNDHEPSTTLIFLFLGSQTRTTIAGFRSDF